MSNERAGSYRGIEMMYSVNANPDATYSVASQKMYLPIQQVWADIEIDGIAVGSFADKETAFARSEARIRQAITHHIDG